MDFFQIVEDRRSMRKYADTPVEAQKLQKILEAINRAPSAGNLQAYEVYVVRKPEERRELVKASGEQEFLAEAPLVLIFCAEPDRAAERYKKRGTQLYCIQDATIACTFAMLAAKAQGLDTVWVGAFDEAAVSEIVHIPLGQRPIAMLPIGYAGKTPSVRPRRELSDLIHEV